MAGIKPLGDRVLVRRDEAADKTDAGIWIPENAKEKLGRGEVIDVGPGIHDPEGNLMPMYVQKGDRVLFGKFVGAEIELEGETYVMVHQGEILGTLT